MLLAVGEDGGTDQLTILYVGRGVDHWKSFTDSTMTFHLCYLPVGGVDEQHGLDVVHVLLVGDM